MEEEVKVDLTLKGEAAFLLQMVKYQTGKEYKEIFSEMIGLYQEVYLNKNKELAWIQGSKIIQKLSTHKIHKKKT